MSQYNITLDGFKSFVTSVVEWNRFARGGSEYFTDKDHELQQNLVVEEGKETTAAMDENNHREIVDGFCDFFVVLSYMMYMGHRIVEQKDGDELTPSEELIDIIAQNEYHAAIGVYRLQSDVIEGHAGAVIRQVLIEYFPDGLDVQANLDAVMASNWSKFPPMEEVKDLQGEIDAIITKYKEDKGQTIDVRVSMRQDSSGTWRYVFQNNETGKIVKPTAFEEPKLVL